MKHRIKRFSYDQPRGINYIGSQVTGVKDRIDQGIKDLPGNIDTGVYNSLDLVNGVSQDLLDHEILGQIKPVKRYGTFSRDLSYLLKRKHKEK